MYRALNFIVKSNLRIIRMFTYPLDKCTGTAGELCFLLNSFEHIVLVLLGLLLFDYDYVLVLLSVDDVIDTTVLIHLTDSAVVFFEFVLALDFLLHLVVLHNRNLSSLCSVEEFFLDHFGLLLFDALGLFLRSFLRFLRCHVHHCELLFAEVFGLGFGSLDDGVYKECESEEDCNHDHYDNHSFVVA